MNPSRACGDPDGVLRQPCRPPSVATRHDGLRDGSDPGQDPACRVGRVLAGEHPSRAGLYGLGETTVVGDWAIPATGTFVMDSFGFAYRPTQAAPAFEHVNGGLYKYGYD